jgi:hypothetical protein
MCVSYHAVMRYIGIGMGIVIITEGEVEEEMEE